MKALNRKAFRDLLHMYGQTLAIALVIAMGVAALVMSQATLLSLQKTQEQLYSEQNFSDIWLTVKRAPKLTLERIKEISGVAEAEGRLMAGAKLSLADFDDPITALVQSLPKQQNTLFIHSGRLPDSADEVMVSNAFANAHGLLPEARIRLTVQGRAQWFTVSGIASSAEYLYQVKPGAMFPDFEHYAIVWMPEEALAAALDMEGAFNQVVLRLTAEADEHAVIRNLDSQLARYGSTGAMGRMDMTSHAILEGEFKSLAVMATLFPAIFLGVAAFLLNMVFKRLFSLQRDQIAIIKAFGYSTSQVALHYALIVVIITLLGNAIGIVCGIGLGHGLADIYQDNFNFPYLRFMLDWQVVAIGAVVSLAAALFGTIHAVYAAAREPVAVAMRPPAPQHFRKSLLEVIGLSRLLSPSTRMIWRQLQRHPLKAALTILAIAFATSIVMMTQFQKASVDRMIAVEFRLANRHDISASFIEDRPLNTLNQLRSIEGVEQVEGFRSLPVRIHHDNYHKLISLQGIPQHAQLRHVINKQLQPVSLPEFGLVLDDMLAEKLHVQVGDLVWVEVVERPQQRLQLPVVQLVPSYTGLSAYMSLSTLNRSLGDSDLINEALLTVESGQESAVLHALDNSPQILVAEERSAGLAQLQKMVDNNIKSFTRMILLMGVIVNFGILYNTVRMNLSEHSRELASLRVLGLHRSEIAYILYGELAIFVILAIPLGLVLGYGIAAVIVRKLDSDLYHLQMVMYSSAYTYTALVTIASTVLSAIAVYPRIHNLDLIEVLKTRE